MSTQTSIVPLALLSDTARMFRQLGVESIRASVVELSTMVLQQAWSISDLGESEDDHRERPLDSTFPGAHALLAEVGKSTSGETTIQKLSPRHWVLAWRLDNLHAVVAEARYREAHGAMGEVHQSLLRLVCNTGIRAKSSTSATLEEEADLLVWPMVERRQSPKMMPKRLTALLLCALSALVAVWLAIVALPGAQEVLSAQLAELGRFRSQSDTTMQSGLSAAMATGDYGEVQTALSSFEQLGHVQRAVVTNVRRQNVAMVGINEGLRIGVVMPADAVIGARVMELKMGAQHYGQLILLKQQGAEQAHIRIGPMRMAAALIVLTSVLAIGLLVRRSRTGRGPKADEGASQ